MKDLIITQFKDILIDNLLYAPKCHNLVIIGSNKIYKLINKLYKDNFTIKDNIEKFQLFCTQKVEFRPGLILYTLNISDKLDLLEIKTQIEKNINNNDDKEQKNLMKKLSSEILVFIKNQNKKFNDDINRRISGIMNCVDNKNEFEQIKEIIKNLKLSIKKYRIELDLYIFNKCINTKDKNNFDFVLDEIISNNKCNEYNIKKENNDESNIINYKEENQNNFHIKSFNITLEEDLRSWLR